MPPTPRTTSTSPNWWSGTSPAISGDGSVIVVEQGGASLAGYDQQGHLLFTITPASVGASGALWKPAISADGHLVAFWNSDAASAGGAGHLFTFDRSTGVVTTIASTASGAGNRRRLDQRRRAVRHLSERFRAGIRKSIFTI